MSVKRIDRTIQMMRQLEKDTADALEAAALKLQAIAKETVSRRYAKKPKQPKSDEDKSKDKAFERQQIREFFRNVKKKQQT